ncbi:phytosulfokine receptor precursor family protein [Tripterygium wilfordii]|uniref:non-specific serine/threonine protein kinase n=1 Tax=Tripterygium wilfordii TaxID=458696 RepID=A0A7J7DUQ6_TRIWF|nr:phytosulfokine receptor 1 [Tripterygium wilfordii]KAF5750033.1 phytosulfokine receptor precursor family protein [Tripterygium wilfordii]
MGFQELWVYVIVVGLCLQAQVLSAQNLTCNLVDLKALNDFLSALESGIDGWGSNSSTDCCNWVGVSCNSSSSLGLSNDPVDYRVTKLELFKKRLTGKLSESLGKLDQLRILNLSQNYLKESLPQSLFHLPKLKFLDLSSNDLSGPFPQSINLPSLEQLDISDNSLDGLLPTRICENSSRIEVIRLAVNSLSGEILPGLGSCSALEHLCLGVNNLTGGISEDIFQIQKLKVLNIQDNMFYGKLSSGIGNLSNLVFLGISSNRFSGTIPDVFYGLSKFQEFVAHSNKFKGTIPRSLSNSPSLNLLNLRNNSLVGSIDVNCSAMINLTSLDLGSNNLSGPVPGYLPLCRKLEKINFARNSLIGQIPESFKNFDSLSYLSLTNVNISNISSALQILQNCKNLDTLVLTTNFPGEAMPADPDIRFEKLKVLVIANCRLTGSLPQWLSGCAKLQLLDLSWNHLGGMIPGWFGKFEDLFYLDLSNNSFTGEIPRNLTGMPSLISRNFSLQGPSWDFPFFMRRSDSGALQYNQVDSFPPTLDLSYNSLTGPIWKEFGELKKLHVLNLRRNNLSGMIPSELSGMTSLETLDLALNNLSGNIPYSLVNLTFLSKFDVADNQLDGKIPTGGQFATFPNSSFEGNDLCGDHGAPPCPEKTSIEKKHRKNSNVIVGMAVGVVFGIAFVFALLVVIVLRTHRRGEVDPEKEETSTNGKDLEELGSRLVILFQNKENCKELSLDDLLKSTNNFDQGNIIGCGGFGLVYKATLPDGRKVAIKRLSGDCGQMDREFQAEVEALSRAQHPNLVHLQGYCMYKNDRLLIYSYMENSSLDYWLHEKLDGPSSLDWDTRLRIAQGAARGLAYLHQSCEPHILHRDIKSSNILLDENFDAHLADFGLARLILPYDTHVTTDLVGTLGYIPPEYGQASVATYKGDVYSFGVVLLELLTGKRPMDMCKPRGSRDLISWAIQMKKDHRENEVFDPFIYGKQHEKEMILVLEIACLCLSESPKGRPSTQQVVSWLDSIVIST